MSQPVQQVPTESENRNWAIFPYKNEFAVAHLGTAKVCGSELFQSVWVVDHICPTMEQAIQCQKDEIRRAKVRAAQIMADMIAYNRRAGIGS